MATTYAVFAILALLMAHILVLAYKDMRAFGVYGTIVHTLPSFE